jgi:hypothetical protein
MSTVVMVALVWTALAVVVALMVGVVLGKPGLPLVKPDGPESPRRRDDGNPGRRSGGLARQNRR